MVREGKSIAAKGEGRRKGAMEEKGRKAALRTREAMDFNPKPCVLRG